MLGVRKVLYSAVADDRENPNSGRDETLISFYAPVAQLGRGDSLRHCALGVLIPPGVPILMRVGEVVYLVWFIPRRSGVQIPHPLPTTINNIMEYTTELFWWQVGDKKFDNKWKAELESQETGMHCSFETHHELYEESLQDASFDDNKDYEVDFLKYLRETHDHIRLHYTGGSDSHTILTKSMQHNICVDETITMMASDNKVISESCDQEYIVGAFPFLEEHNIKSVAIRSGFDFINHLYKNPNWFFDVRGGYTFVRPHSMNFEYYDGINRQTDCNLIGKEKPTLINQGNKWYVSVLDNTIFDHIGLPKSVFFWLHPLNIKSFVKNARQFRNFINDKSKIVYSSGNYKGQEYVDLCNAMERTPVPNDITGKNNMSKASGRIWCNKKDKAMLIDLINNDKIECLVNYYSSMDTIRTLFPSIVESDGFINRLLPAKFPFYIDIDTLEYFRPNQITMDFKNK